MVTRRNATLGSKKEGVPFLAIVNSCADCCLSIHTMMLVTKLPDTSQEGARTGPASLQIVWVEGCDDTLDRHR